MRTRTQRDPLAPDRLERFLDRYGFARVLVAGTALTATLVLSGMAAIFVVTGLWITAEAVVPSVPDKILSLGASRPTPTDTVAPADAHEPTASPTTTTPAVQATRSSERSSRSTAPERPLPSVLASVLPEATRAAQTPAQPATAPPAPMLAPAAAVQPTTAPTTPDAVAAPHAVPSTTTDSAPSTSTTAATPTPTDGDDDHRGGRHDRRCWRHPHKKGC